MVEVGPGKKWGLPGLPSDFRSSKCFVSNKDGLRKSVAVLAVPIFCVTGLSPRAARRAGSCFPFAQSVRRPPDPRLFLTACVGKSRRGTLWFPARVEANRSSPNGDTWRARYSQEGGRKTRETDIALDRLEKNETNPISRNQLGISGLWRYPRARRRLAQKRPTFLGRCGRVVFTVHGSRPNGNNDDQTNPNLGR